MSCRFITCLCCTEHLYIVTYAVAPGRWRRVFRLMEGFGEWLQLSVFQCRLTAQQHAELIALLDGIIHHDHDHFILMDVGPADQVASRVVSLGKTYEPAGARASHPLRRFCRGLASALVMADGPGSAR
jgi:CRISPR-associated protein Cas2